MTINKIKKPSKVELYPGEEEKLPKGIAAALEAVPEGVSAVFFSNDQVFGALNLGEGSDSAPASPGALAAYVAASLFKPENKDLRDELERRMEQDRALAEKALSKHYDA